MDSLRTANALRAFYEASMFDLEVSNKSLQVRAWNFPAIANLLQPGIVFIHSPSPSPISKAKIIQISSRQCYWNIHTFLSKVDHYHMVERLNRCWCRLVSRCGRVRVNPFSSAIASILKCQLSGIENHFIFDSLLASCGRLHGQAVRYMPVYRKNAVVAVLRSWQSVYRYGVPHVIKGRHCSHVSSGCRNTIRKMVGLSGASSLMPSNLRKTLRSEHRAPPVNVLPGNRG
jgi:hypothetical protein